MKKNSTKNSKSRKSKALALRAESSVTIDPFNLAQTHALTSISQSLSLLANFVTSNALQNTVQSVVRANGALGLLGAIFQKDGFDVRRIKQYGIEVTEVVEALLAKYTEKLKDRSRDPEIHDAEDAFNKA
jgi:hypothetical protein